MKNVKISGKKDALGKKIGIILTLAFIGWAICGMIMGVGLATTTEDNALILHAAFVPVVFFSVSFLYFSKFNYTTPLQTAGIFVTFVILMDIFVVSMLINKSFEMFYSFLGTWFVFGEIFVTTLLTGKLLTEKGVSIRTKNANPQLN
jgi:uncharacterized RDD family membrane protein YckC